MAWPMYEQVERRARRLKDMISRTGVSPRLLIRHGAGATIDKATLNCLACPHPTACMDWLDDPSHQGDPPPRFCSNRSLLEQFRTAR
ncbi:MAG: DUF6455 family protein [Hyphomicrobiaceae bacterium]